MAWDAPDHRAMEVRVSNRQTREETKSTAAQEPFALPQPRHHYLVPSVTLVIAMVLTACASTMPTPSQQPTSSPSLNASAAASPGAPSSTANTSGFAFSVDGVVGYYQSQGYVCSTVQPSATAAGYSYRSCQTQDSKGRTLVIGLVTDPAGALGDGFASVQGTADEPILAPTDALESLSGFLGAMLGADRGTALLTWLAGHLGDEYAETTSGLLRVATYTASSSDHSKLYVELANQAYLDAPKASASP
jgi:hypothetical protein